MQVMRVTGTAAAAGPAADHAAGTDTAAAAAAGAGTAGRSAQGAKAAGPASVSAVLSLPWVTQQQQQMVAGRGAVCMSGWGPSYHRRPGVESSGARGVGA